MNLVIVKEMNNRKKAHLLGDFWLFLNVFLLRRNDGPESSFDLRRKHDEFIEWRTQTVES